MPFTVKALLLFVAGGIAGMINSVAGGGTLVSFPALVFSGAPAIEANATNTVALLPGLIGAFWGYRREFASQRAWAWRFGPPSFLGGLLGAILLLRTGEASFRALIPYLILFAAILFTFQPAVSRWLRIEGNALGRSRYGFGAALLFQFCVGIYGGYFGAGMGILMLAALAVLGQSDIHAMNSLRVVLGLLINGVAAIYFVASGSILWMDALLMAGGALVGGYGGAELARKLGARVVRAFVSAAGFAIGIYFLYQ
ncbi:MAG: sulfite exporter TauE/SafE family protein [Acidobacteria bacterium]|nr:sulfite exporter TauE/SafE family protein [Acidobacteriota bacterium]